MRACTAYHNYFTRTIKNSIAVERRTCLCGERTGLRLLSWYLKEKKKWYKTNGLKSLLNSGERKKKKKRILFVFLFLWKKFGHNELNIDKTLPNKNGSLSNSWSITYRFLQVHKLYTHISSKSCCGIYKAKCLRDIEVNIFFCSLKHTGSHL